MSLTPITYLLVCVGLSASVWPSRTTRADPWRENDNATDASDRAFTHDERPNDPWMAGPPRRSAGGVPEPSVWTRGPCRSIQVNVDALGQNIEGDAANEPSIAIDPTDPCKMAIGWRQFDTIESDFRQAGWGYSHDKGETWTFT